MSVIVVELITWTRSCPTRTGTPLGGWMFHGRNEIGTEDRFRLADLELLDVAHAGPAVLTPYRRVAR
jgi:hypothetical protein